MKTKTLLLAGLSAVLLAGCGGLKSYKTEVKMETFLSSLEKLQETSPLLDENPYSFEMKQSKELKNQIIYLQDKDELSKAVDEEKSEGEYKFDVINSILITKTSGEEKHEDPTYEKKEVVDYERVLQKDSKNLYEVDKKSETYTKDESADPEKAIAKAAMEQGLGLISAFAEHVAEIGKDGTYYIDGDTYTVVLDKIDENSSRTKHLKTICQLTANKEGYEYYCSDLVEIEELHRKDIDYSLDKGSFKKKAVNLKAVDLHEYLEVDELDFPAF